MYGSNKKDIMEIIKKLCEMKGVSIIDGAVRFGLIGIRNLPLSLHTSISPSFLFRYALHIHAAVAKLIL